MKKRSWTPEQLLDAVKNSYSLRQVIAKLGLIEAGGNYQQIKKYILEYGFDSSHFRGKLWSKGLKGIGKPRIPLERVLVRNSTFQSFKLKQRLFAAGLKERKCEECGWARYSESGHLPLELDHINGDSHDNRIKNLRVLCPNCHSLKPTHRGRNMGRRSGVIGSHATLKMS